MAESNLDKFMVLAQAVFGRQKAGSSAGVRWTTRRASGSFARTRRGRRARTSAFSFDRWEGIEWNYNEYYYISSICLCRRGGFVL